MAGRCCARIQGSLTGVVKYTGEKSNRMTAIIDDGANTRYIIYARVRKKIPPLSS